MIYRALIAVISLCNVSVVLAGSILSTDWMSTSIILAVVNIFIGASFGLGFDIGKNMVGQIMHVGIQHVFTALVGLAVALGYGLTLKIDPFVFFYGFGVYLGAVSQQVLISQNEILKALIVQVVSIFLVNIVIVWTGLNPGLAATHFTFILGTLYLTIFRPYKLSFDQGLRGALFSKVSFISLIFTYIDRIIYQKLNVDQSFYVISDWIGRSSILQSISRAYLGNSVSPFICQKITKFRWFILCVIVLTFLSALYLDSWLIVTVPLMCGFALNRVLSDYILFEGVAYFPLIATFLIGILFIACLIMTISFQSLWAGIIHAFFLKWMLEFLYLTWVTNRGVKIGSTK